ncbi:MAG: HAMP domain-containing histidine kinase [Cocleimonas sp.]|nr:HAMP domain-containing histidine kinase [Cocleimonas sp.]
MPKNTLTGLDKKKLRRWLLLFFFALAIPAAILIQQSYSRLKWETFHQHQLMADELSNRIDAEFLRLINIEEQRSFTDYSFLNIAGNITNQASLLQRSPLSQFPLESEIEGLIGYFQVDSEGQLITPLLPGLLSEPDKLENNAKLYGIGGKEFTARILLQNQIQSILSKNSLVKNTPPSISLQKADRKKLKSKKRNKSEGESFLGGIVGSRSSKSMEQGASMTSGSVDSAPSYSANDTNSVMLEEKLEEPNAQMGFDQLKHIAPKLAQKENNLGRIEDLKLKKTYSKEIQLEAKRAPIEKKKTASVSKFSSRSRKEQNRLPESELSMMIEQDSVKSMKGAMDKDIADLTLSDDEGRKTKSAASTTVTSEALSAPIKQATLKIRTFESSIDPFEFSQLDSGHFVLFRNVWLNNKRTIQGLLIDQKPFLGSIINNAFRQTSLSQMSDLLVSHQGNVLSVFSANASNTYLTKKHTMSGELLHQTRLSDPLGEIQLLFSIQELPVGAGGKIILWLSLLLASVLCAGLYLMYRLGLAQINLANQQQDFVSAVSHELKTPLTSIRMYSEMLREGWANDEKKKTYYDFIFDESERLSRLINNVLHLARVTRNKQTAELKVISVPELIDGVRSKVSTQIKHAGFEFNLICNEESKDVDLEVDADWFIQIMINLVDNAIKFSANAKQKKIDLSCELQKKDIKFIIRDYGPGVDKTQMKKIFDLFYRTESELTRETVGTGIGLALVHQMTVNMGGKIDVVNREPGAEFRVVFPFR